GLHFQLAAQAIENEVACHGSHGGSIRGLRGGLAIAAGGLTGHAVNGLDPLCRIDCLRRLRGCIEFGRKAKCEDQNEQLAELRSWLFVIRVAIHCEIPPLECNRLVRSQSEVVSNPPQPYTEKTTVTQIKHL